MTARAVQKRAAAGLLHRLHAGVYSLVPRQLLKREGLWMAGGARLRTRRRPVPPLCGRTPRAPGLGRHQDRGDRPAVAPDADTTGIKVHCSTTLTDEDVTEVNNIPCTTIARTLFDLGDVVTQRQLERSFDQAEISERLDLTAIDDQLARNPTRPGAKAVRHVLETHYIGRTPTWSENEEALLAITRELGIPDPDTNQFIVLDDGGPPIRVDFVWREDRVIVEADSKKWHSSRQRLEQDRVRDQRLMAAGWKIIRTTWNQMTQRPHELRPLLLKLLVPGFRAAHG